MVAGHRESQAKDNQVKECMKYTQAIPATVNMLWASPAGKMKKVGVSITSMFGAFPSFSPTQCRMS